jgi:hypothetical protein
MPLAWITLLGKPFRSRGDGGGNTRNDMMPFLPFPCMVVIPNPWSIPSNSLVEQLSSSSSRINGGDSFG